MELLVVHEVRLETVATVYLCLNPLVRVAEGQHPRKKAARAQGHKHF